MSKTFSIDDLQSPKFAIQHKIIKCIWALNVCFIIITVIINWLTPTSIEIIESNSSYDFISS